MVSTLTDTNFDLLGCHNLPAVGKSWTGGAQNILSLPPKRASCKDTLRLLYGNVLHFGRRPEKFLAGKARVLGLSLLLGFNGGFGSTRDSGPARGFYQGPGVSMFPCSGFGFGILFSSTLQLCYDLHPMRSSLPGC